MRERQCGYAVTRLLWTLCHSWRSIGRPLMCPFIPPSLRISTTASCSVHQPTASVHPSIFHFPFTLTFTPTDDKELPVGPSECACLWSGARVPGENRHRQAPGQGIKPASFLLQCDSANHCTTMMPRLQVASLAVHCRCTVSSKKDCCHHATATIWTELKKLQEVSNKNLKPNLQDCTFRVFTLPWGSWAHNRAIL